MTAAMAGGRGGRGPVGPVEEQSGEEKAADEIAERDRKLVPQPPVGDGDFGAEHHAGRDHEHVDDRVLEALGEEGEDRQPHRGDFADGGMRGHRHDHAEADHPVAEDRLHENRDEAGETVRGVADGLGLGDLDDVRGDAARRLAAHAGERDVKQHAVEDAADEVGEKHPAEIRR